MKVVFGIDPDSEAFGLAEFRDDVLESLAVLQLVAVVDKALFARQMGCEVVFSIENVMANQFVYARNRQRSKSAESQIAMRIGRCQQAQIELMRMLDHYQFPYVLHKPQKGNWADKRELFEKLTGWNGSSNPDTRAAAYFGFLALGHDSKNLRPASVRLPAMTKTM